jgi:hypothetical protein
MHILRSLLVAAAASTSFLHVVQAASDVVDLTADNFKNEVLGEDLALVEFFAPWVSATIGWGLAGLVPLKSRRVGSQSMQRRLRHPTSCRCGICPIAFDSRPDTYRELTWNLPDLALPTVWTLQEVSYSPVYLIFYLVYT